MTKSTGFLPALAILLVACNPAFAGSATWLTNPASGDWNVASNWTPGGPPNNPADTATFEFSSVTSLLLSGSMQISGITFSAVAGTSYTISLSSLAIVGSGITNNSGATHTFVPYSEILFTNSASAGLKTAFIMGGDYGDGAFTYFFNNSIAGNATLTANGSNRSDGSGGGVSFYDHSSADNSTITVNGSAFQHCPPGENCFDRPHPAAHVFFGYSSTAGNATLIANGGIGNGDGGAIAFQQVSTGGTARVKIFGNGNLDMSSHDLQSPGITIGSLEGNGVVYLGQFILTVGSNNFSTNFSGVLRNGFSGGSGSAIGSLNKIGTGTLTLSGANTYTGTTTVNRGNLEVDGSIPSLVTVNNGGTLGGSGTTRDVMVDSGGTVAPGGSQTLHINGNYLQHRDGALKIDVVGTDPEASSRLDITGNATLAGTLEIRFQNGLLRTSGQVIKVLNVTGALSGSFAQIIFPDLRAGFQFQPEFVNGTYQIRALNDGVPATGFRNISTRLKVGAGDDALIGGFIVQDHSTGSGQGGTTSKRVIVRAIGPSLALGGTPLVGRLADPTLELRDNGGALIASNNDWGQSAQAQEIMESGLAPSDAHEAAIVATLAPGSYTAVMRGTNNSTGIGVVEVYDPVPEVPAKLANISSRGLVETGDNVMIGGFIADNQAMHVMVRALGPSLTPFGIANALADPTLALHNAQGAMIASNDDWADSIDRPAVEAAGLEPTNAKESAIPATLAPGNYTAIVRGKNETIGVALVEVYQLP